MWVKIFSSVWRLAVSSFETGAVANVIYTSFFPSNWHDYISPMHNMSFKLAFDSPMLILQKRRQFIKVPGLLVHVHIGV